MLLVILLGTLAPEVVVARVGAEDIDSRSLAQRMDAERAQGVRRKPDEVLEVLIGENLLAQDGLRAGLARDAELAPRLESGRRRLAAERLVQHELLEGLKVSDASLKRMYHQTADQVQLDLIVRTTRDEAQGAIDRLKAGGALATEAAATLDNASKLGHGALGWKKRSELQPAVADAAFAATPRTWSGPVQLELGWAALRVGDRQIGDEAGFSAKRESLRRYGEELMRSQAREHYLKQLRAGAKVTIDEAFLKSTGTRADGDAAQLAHVVAQVGSHQVRYGELLAESKRMFGGVPGGHGTGGSFKSELAQVIVDQLLLEDAAIKRGLDKSPEVVAEVRRLEHQLVGEAYTRRLRAEVPRPTAAEVEAYYASHAAEFRATGARRCAHILAPSKKEAEKLRKRVTSGESFAAVARSASSDTDTREAGGSLGELSDERLTTLGHSLPALAAALRDARAGEVSAPVETPVGFHLVRCEAAGESHARPLAEVRAGIEARLQQQRTLAVVEKRIAELRNKNKVTINHDAVARAAATASR